jgi:Porin subfamily
MSCVLQAVRFRRVCLKSVCDRARTLVSFDARTQTEYGTLRSYARFGFILSTNQQPTGGLYTERAFVQFAGFTFGKTQSYFDTWAHAWAYAHAFLGAGANTSALGRNLIAYTATFGNGVTWTIAAEETTSRRGALWDAGTNGLALGAFPGPNTWGIIASPDGCPAASVTSDQNIGNTAGPFSVSDACATGDYAAQSIPDIVSSLRVNQAWGSAQISGALHQVRGNFYGNDTQSTISSGPNAWTGIRQVGNYAGREQGKPAPSDFPVLRNIVVAPDRGTAIRDVGPAIAESYRIFGNWGLFTGVVGDAKTHPQFEELIADRKNARNRLLT